MDYDVEADWLLLKTCNFRCAYCFFDADFLGAPLKTWAEPTAWRQGFDRTGKTWLLHLTGGEPTLYPDFVGLCSELTQNHFISLNTNLSHPGIEKFARAIDPERVNFINVSIHWMERLKRSGLSTFFQRIELLRKAGFHTFASLVMTPELFGRIEEIHKQFSERGLSFIPKTLRGDFKGRKFPEAYSDEEKRLMEEYLELARGRYQPVLDSMKAPPTINMFSDDDFFYQGPKVFRGRLCEAGRRFVVITPNGSVLKCGSEEVLGNVLKNRIKFFKKPRPCDTDYCPYFCEKYSYPAVAASQGAETGQVCRPGTTARLRRMARRAYFYYQVEGPGFVVNKALEKLKS